MHLILNMLCQRLHHFCCYRFNDLPRLCKLGYSRRELKYQHKHYRRSKVMSADRGGFTGGVMGRSPFPLEKWGEMLKLGK